MDSTPTLSPTQAIKSSSASKLPIKRKPTHPNQIRPSRTPYQPHYEDGHVPCPDQNYQPPFKFQRIWTEPDEIRLLQGLLNSGFKGHSFPRDLNIFYARFSDSMSQPYTRPQLSEKLRRLRKKFRVTSARLSNGLKLSLLPPHDRSLYEISMRLWHPDYAGSSPFFRGANDRAKESDLVGVEVSFLPELASDPDPNTVESFDLNRGNNEHREDDDGFENVGFDGDVKLREVDVKFDEEDEMGWRNREVAVAKAVIDVFHQSLEEVRLRALNEGLSLKGCEKEGKRLDFDRLWRKQKVAELDVLGRRMRLVLEQSIMQRQ